MPSQSVEAATRDEAIAAAREQFGPAARVTGVRRIRSGGMFGFFANERFIAEVEVTRPETEAAEPGTGSGTGAGPVLRSAAARTEPSTASMDDRMRELADLLGAASQAAPSAGLYGRSGPVADPGAPAAATPATAAARPAGRSGAPRSSAASATGSSAGTTVQATRAAAPARATPAAKPFTPARHTLMLAPEELAPDLAEPAPPVAEKPSGPSPFAAALTRMVASDPVQAAAERAAAEAATRAATEAATEAATQAAAIEAAALEAAAADAAAAQAAAVEAAAAEAARAAAARIEAAAAEAARLRAETAAAEAAAAEAARLRAATAAEAARLEAEAAEEARRLEAARAEAERLEAEGLEAERLEAERLEAERLEAERLEAERLEAEQVAAAAQAAAAAEAQAAAAAEAAAPLPAPDRGPGSPPQSMVESVRAADEELAALLEQVLAARGSGRGRGRHRLPDAGPDLADDGPTAAAEPLGAAAGSPSPTDAPTDGPAGTPLAGEERVRDVPQPWACGASAYDSGTHRSDPRAGQAWASETRIAQRAAQVAAAQDLVVDAVVVDETPQDLHHGQPWLVEVPVTTPEAELVAVPVPLAPAMARTASDPAPLPSDATMVLPPLSLMPPQRFAGDGEPLLRSSHAALPPARRGRPPVPASRPAVSSRPHVPTRPVPIPVPIVFPAATSEPPAGEVSGTRLATVTRLVPAVPASMAPAPFTMDGAEELVVRLLTLGVPDFLLDQDFSADAAARGVYAALTRALAERLPTPPPLPAGPGDVLMIVGPGAEAFAAARMLALSLRLEPDDVQWAASGALAGLAPEGSRITSLETAARHREASSATGDVTIVAVDAPLRTSGGPWLEHMLAAWSPSAVWAVLDSTRKPEDLVPWLEGLPCLDAVVVQDTESTADPAAVLGHVSVPVALVDGARATAHRWASLLCERLEEMDA